VPGETSTVAVPTAQLLAVYVASVALESVDQPKKV
jgi:hypothetical protein